MGFLTVFSSIIIFLLAIGLLTVLALSLLHGYRGHGLYCNGKCHYHPECSYHYLVRFKEIVKLLSSKTKNILLSIIIDQPRR